MCPGLSNAVSMIIFRCLVMKIQSDEVTSFLVIFDDFLVSCTKKRKWVKMTENGLTSSDWIFITRHRKIIIDTAFESPRHILFKKNNFGQHLVNRCWLNLYPPFPYQNRAKICPPNPQMVNLVNRCWLNVDQNYFLRKYDIRAFQRRVGRPCIPLSHWDIFRGKKTGFSRRPFPGVKYIYIYT